ncbi:hypothetical protein, partial [Thiomonas sp. FB-Cd]|uniref:hypothetical protein n=1 Tax=Thiomonas sp. FB-Cd TaxID=1158292 RepID=UPI0012DDBCAA
MLARFQLFLKPAEVLRDGSLLFQLVELTFQLTQDVIDPEQVFTRAEEAVFGFAPAFLVFGYARCFFQHHPQLLGARFDDACDRALPNDGVGASPKSGAKKNVLDVTPAHKLVIDEIARRAVAREYPLDGDFRVLTEAPGDAVVTVIEDQLNA